ncbi:MAG: glycosyltransferase family 2 protein [Saprospiraceae bacterium]|nr:glycosyltransferase family 2 protein [Saprospiraceae bacterium]
MQEPLVTCVMPTYNRRQFVPNAILYFLRQDYSNKELLIVDDGSDNIADLVPQHEQIRYIRLNSRMILGEKRNFCVCQSKGDYIMHWDDDDWIASWRIRYQMKELLASNNSVCGLKEILYQHIESGKCWLYKYPPTEKPWLAGNTLLYTRNFWEKKPFPAIQVASDTQFIFSRTSEPFTVLNDYRFYVATVHTENTSPKNYNNSWWHPIQSDMIKEVMAEESCVHSNPIFTNSSEKPTIVCKAEYVEKKKVTACLLAYKRHENMQAIVQSLEQYDFIDEIIIWNNLAGTPLKLEGKKVRVINSDVNMLCYGRFLCAKQAKNEIIYVQDDDVIVQGIPSLFQSFLNDDTGIVHALNTNHYQHRYRYVHFYGQGALIGWGAFFKKSWLKVLDEFLSENIDNYCSDGSQRPIYHLNRVKTSCFPIYYSFVES